MIPRKAKICQDCKKSKPIWSNKRCLDCDRAYKRRKDTPQPPYKRRSTLSKGRVPLDRQSSLKRTYIKPRSAKRAEQEKEYAKIKPKNKECIFCGVPFKKREKRDRHHLRGRVGHNLIDKKYIFYVHRKCHADYHDKAVKDIWWFDNFLNSLKAIDEDLYQKELNKYDK